MKFNLQKELRKLDLTGLEISVYLFLLQKGLSSPPQIAKGVGVARTNTYHLLDNLMNKRLISRQKKGRRYLYFADDPDSALRLIERKKESMEKILPDLKALHKSQENKPSIRFFDGWEDVKNIYKQVLSCEELLAVGSTEAFSNIDQEFFKNFQKDLKSNGILVRDLLPEASRGRTAVQIKEALGKLYEQRFMPERFLDIPADILIWSDNVALVSLKAPVFGTLVTNRDLSQTFRTLFELSWLSSRK